MSKSFYLTTTLPYVNAEPHIGFALELVQADIIARYRALMGDEVFFNTGTDEHGLKVFRKSQEEGKDPQTYTDEYAAKFRVLPTKLGVSSDVHFIRTTDAHHKQAAQEFWKRCEKDIYKKTYKGLYCVGDEAFVKESDLVNGRCPNHLTMDLIEIEEENYFFALSKYQDRLLKYLEQPNVIVPEWRRQEAINFVNGGLEDFSISRVKDRLPWGVPVPNDDSQVMYVWFDALVNYISTLGWPKEDGDFKKFWVDGSTLQFAGKDQVRFQSIMWQAMLMSAGLKTTGQVLYHGFITSDGKKMSKSIGNVIEPVAVIDEYGADAVRYFLARHVSPFEDSDFTMERFKEAYNADLANGLGNLAARIMTLAERNLPQPVTTDVFGGNKEFHQALASFEFASATEYIWSMIQLADQRINATEPFKLVKTDLEEGKSIIADLVRRLDNIAQLLAPIMPGTSEVIRAAVRENKKPENLFPRKE